MNREEMKMEMLKGIIREQVISVQLVDGTMLYYRGGKRIGEAALRKLVRKAFRDQGYVFQIRAPKDLILSEMDEIMLWLRTHLLQTQTVSVWEGVHIEHGKPMVEPEWMKKLSDPVRLGITEEIAVDGYYHDPDAWVADLLTARTVNERASRVGLSTGGAGA